MRLRDACRVGEGASKEAAMCDYSLEQLASRAAVKGDRLVVTAFSTTTTRGFTSETESSTAVCLLPGTEVVFDRPPRLKRFWLFGSKIVGSKAARFREINAHDPHCHHDALEFSDGVTVLLTRLKVGEIATVLQLPRQGGCENTNATHAEMRKLETERI
jgi:hypothetical protein